MILSHRAMFLSAALLVFSTTVSGERQPDEPTVRARAAVIRALPLLQQSADTWFKRRGCASCHHQGLGMMAVAFARERGFPVDGALLATQVHDTVSDPVAGLERLIVGEASANESIGISYRHVGVASAGGPIGLNSPLVSHMLAGKQMA